MCKADPATISSVLVIGSGPIQIGQGAEFDYSGSQACRVLREEGVRVIVHNCNPATIQTDRSSADAVYFRPPTEEAVVDILQREEPDGVIATMGGQHALNLLVSLEEKGLWEEHGVRILGTGAESVRNAEGRLAFRTAMQQAGQPVVESTYVNNTEEAIAFAAETGYPVVVRPDFTLGGHGGGTASSPEELRTLAEHGLAVSPTRQVLVERCLNGWREVEYEMIRDGSGNALCVCTMENIDPMGVHTGDSVVVAPNLTLTDRQNHRLRQAALDIVNHLDIRGACNVQFALHPDGGSYHVIEVNPRASRSSALASKATGYPIARIATKIALGRGLTELTNPVTGVSSALAEPALDYVVVKIPRWPFDKFPRASTRLGTSMKATGEVMAMGTTVVEALQKAFRSLELPLRLTDRLSSVPAREIEEGAATPSHKRLLYVTELLRRGYSPMEIRGWTGIQPYFLRQLAKLTEWEHRWSDGPPSPTRFREGKALGVGDAAMAALKGVTEDDIRTERKKHGIPTFQPVDTCAAEYPSATGYLYGTHLLHAPGETGESADRHDGESVVVLGSGPIRMGQGLEFDYCCVKAVEALQKIGYRPIMVNNNPSTVSTDFDITPVLYAEPVTYEDVMDIVEREHPLGVFGSFGGQTALKVARALDTSGVPLLGNSAAVVDIAEDRKQFARLLDDLGIPQPASDTATAADEALDKAERLGFPLMVRPSYVIGGRAMRVVRSPAELEGYLTEAVEASEDHPVLLDSFLKGVEFEIDAVCDGADIHVPAIIEHLDPAGVHSGDSIAMLPALSHKALHSTMIAYVRAISERLGLKGLLNVQFIVNEGTVYVIEANPRASRTVPIISKVTGVPMVELAVRVAMDEPLRRLTQETGPVECGNCAVKVPVFSTARLEGVEVAAGPEMRSTGESLGVASSMGDALADALEGAGWKRSAINGVLFSASEESKQDVLPLASSALDYGWEVYATAGTAALLEQWGLEATKTLEDGTAVAGCIRNGEIGLVVNIPRQGNDSSTAGFRLRRLAAEWGVPCITSMEVARAVFPALSKRNGRCGPKAA